MAGPLLKDRVAIVTGGAKGLGRAMVLVLAEAGARVVAADKSIEDLQALSRIAEGEITTIAGDIRKPADCRLILNTALKEMGGLHILVNNAGLLPSYAYPNRFLKSERPKFWEVTDEIVQNVMDTNFVAHERMTRAAVPHLRAQGWGRIINVTTRLDTMNRAGGSPYGASKAALEMASEVWTKDLEGSGVTVNILNPGGAADTDGFATHEERELVRSQGRIQLMDPDRMRAPVVWLSSRATDDITGMRYDAEFWDPKALPAEEAAKWGRPLGFVLKPQI